MSDTKRRKAGGAKSEIEAAIPDACRSEGAAVAFLEAQRWPNGPACAHCGSVAVYPMTDKGGGRSKRFLWRCRPKEGCGMQFTVRVGTVFEESRIPLRYWLHAFFRACSSKKGISALQIKRECGLSYKSALFLMHRIRLAMQDGGSPLTGTVEADETFIGGKAANMHADKRAEARAANFPKVPVMAMVERGGRVRTQVLPTVSAGNLHTALRAAVHPSAIVMTDDGYPHAPIRETFAGHEWVNHSAGEYGRGEVHSNTVEGFFSLFKRRIYGTHHAVSPRHLGRYATEAAFLYSTRQVNDGERTVLAIRGAEGKRLAYRTPADGRRLA